MEKYFCNINGEVLEFRGLTLLDEIRIQELMPDYMDKSLSNSLDMASVCKTMAMVYVGGALNPVAHGDSVLQPWEVLASKITSEEDSARLVNTYSAVCRGSRPVDDADDIAQKKKAVARRLKKIFFGSFLFSAGILVGSLLKP